MSLDKSLTQKDHQQAQEIIKNRSVDEVLKRFISDVVMNGKNPDIKDSLVIAYSLMQASSRSDGRKALGLSAHGRGKSIQMDLDSYPMGEIVNGKNIVQIVWLFNSGKINQEQAVEELRLMIGERVDGSNPDKQVDKKTLCALLDEACIRYSGLVHIFGELLNQWPSRK